MTQRTKEVQLRYNDSLTSIQVKASPFIKWAGGKGQLIPQYARLFPAHVERYFEPFMGGGAIFFHLQPRTAFLSDTNEELVNVYQIVRHHVRALIDSLRCHRNEEEYFYSIRDLNPADMSPIQRASRFIYLNRTCFNGLYRVNRSGKFNVPFGRYKNPTICDPQTLLAASQALKPVRLTVADFEKALGRARGGDFVYLDPPYHPLNHTSSFTSYTQDNFGEDEQRRLADVVKDLNRRECLFMLSNSNTNLVRELYCDFKVATVKANRAINSVGSKRGPVEEVVVTNY